MSAAVALRVLVVLSCLGLAAPTIARAQRYRYPLTCDGCAYVSAYIDHDRSGGREDWNCRAHTYNTHDGTDFALNGRFSSMDRGRNVVAAADGRVIAIHDGEADRCTSGRCGQANFVYIEHDNGRRTLYGHLRRRSIRVRRGQRVRCGRVIGQVGSSGNSTGPHLHFEVTRGDPFTTFEPYAGPCGRGRSWWVNQRGYRRLPGTACVGDTPPSPEPPPEPPPAEAEDAGAEPPVPPEDPPSTDAGPSTPPALDASTPPPPVDGAAMVAPDAGPLDDWTPDAAPDHGGGTLGGTCACEVSASGGGTANPLGLTLLLGALLIRRTLRRRRG